MNPECIGCYLIRSTIESHKTLDQSISPDAVSCVHQDQSDCPCKSCLVKITCDMIENMIACEKFMDFNIKYPTNDYWRERREERECLLDIKS